MISYTKRWTDEQIIHYFDTHWNTTMQEIANRSGWSVAYIKRVLFGDDWND